MKYGEVRIIGGSLRGRKLKFPAVPGLRPTPNRVRETVFNWLRDSIQNSRCLDLFAGSGALGFEALSRGASHVSFVDTHKLIIAYLKRQLLSFEKQTISSVYYAKLPTLPTALKAAFDIIFLDPPFHQNLIFPSLQILEDHLLIQPGGYIYIEAETVFTPTPLTEKNWLLLHSKRAGQVSYYLFKKPQLDSTKTPS